MQRTCTQLSGLTIGLFDTGVDRLKVTLLSMCEILGSGVDVSETFYDSGIQRRKVLTHNSKAATRMSNYAGQRVSADQLHPHGH